MARSARCHVLLPQEWLADRRGRDQYVIRYGDETEVHWNDVAR